jgi:hypothetical protein
MLYSVSYSRGGGLSREKHPLTIHPDGNLPYGKAPVFIAAQALRAQITRPEWISSPTILAGAKRKRKTVPRKGCIHLKRFSSDIWRLKLQG